MFSIPSGTNNDSDLQRRVILFKVVREHFFV